MKDEIYRVAGRHGLNVTLVANTWMHTPSKPSIVFELVAEGADVADDWIAEHVEAHDIVITGDVPLASRCVKKDAIALGPTGKVFTENNMGNALATRDLLTELRSAGEITRGPAPIQERDRSRFLQQLDTVINGIRRKHPGDAPS